MIERQFGRALLGSRWLPTPSAVHLAFVVSTVILDFVDRIAFAAHRESGH